MLRVAVPNKGTLAGPASEMLTEAGYRQRHEPRDLTVLDPVNDVEFFFLRPKDIAIYVGSGELDLGITGRDLAMDSGAEVRERLALGFGGSTFRYAAPEGRSWDVAALAGRRIATAYARLVSTNLARHGVAAEVIRLDGAVEISVQLGVADAIADVVGSGRTLRQHGLLPFGEPICVSEAVLIDRASAPDTPDTPDTADTPEKAQLVARLQGVVFAQQYLMIDYDCPRGLLDKAIELTPGLESPTVAPLAEPDWVAVRAMVPRKDANQVMDSLHALGTKAILASDIRSCRL
jgi:ATP phosphoribosyltransferase